ncbi:hypothetical protein [Candidatus Villigracilis affinis]|uniref:WD40 repeat domain-containing protein n=1 Tax=Candidatus Villigracilis affinis TaxID=3140682 RepID=UPI001D3BA4A1|nr:hypothetical protein [Anaerolineales bacterium]
MKHLSVILFIVLATVSCSNLAPAVAINTETATAVSPVSTSLPNVPLTPEFPVQDGGTVNPGDSVISKDNLPQLTELAVWGKGFVTKVDWSDDGSQFSVDTSLGRNVYEYASLQRVEDGSALFTEDKAKIYFNVEDSGLSVDEFGRQKRQFLVRVISAVDSSEIGSFYVDRLDWISVESLSERNTIVVKSGTDVELRDGTSYEILAAFGGVAYTYDVAEDGSYSFAGDYYSALDVSKDQKIAATGQFDGKIILRSGEGFSDTLTLETEGPVRFLSFSPDGTRLLVESNGRISIWDVLSGKVISTLPDTFISGDFFYDQYRFGTDAGLGVAVKENKIAYTNKNIVFIVDLLDGKRVNFINGKAGSLLDKQEDGKYGHPDYQPVTNVFFSADGQSLITVLEGRTYVWDISDNRNQFIKSMAQVDEKELYGLVSVYSASDHLLLVGNAFSSFVRVWNADDGTALPSIKVWAPNSNPFQPDGTHSLTISPDGKFVFSWSGLEGVASLWEIQTQKSVMTIKIPASEYSQYKPGFFPVAISPDNSKILFTYSLNPDARVATVYSIPDGKELYRISEYYAAFSPDSSMIAASVGDNVIRFYDSETGEQIGEVNGKYPNKNGFQLLYFSEDGKSLIAVSTNGTISVWGIP